MKESQNNNKNTQNWKPVLKFYFSVKIHMNEVS